MSRSNGQSSQRFVPTERPVPIVPLRVNRPAVR